MSSPVRPSLQSFAPTVVRTSVDHGPAPCQRPSASCYLIGSRAMRGCAPSLLQSDAPPPALQHRSGTLRGMPDRRVSMAIEHWAARFTANGVDPADFTRVTAAIDRWDEWCAAWCRAAAEHEDLGRRALGNGRGRSGGSHLAQAAVYFHFAKFLFVQDAGQMREAHAAAVRCLNDALPHLSPPGE